MSVSVEFTGERFLPECAGEIWAEHWHRYLFAAHFVAGKDVLDAASGEGYGSAYLARRARSVSGLDIDQETIDRASRKYQVPGLRFETGSVIATPYADATFDCVVSFETLEHLAEHDAMLAEFRRVLRPDGMLIISTPNRPEYSERRNFRNPFHVRELNEREFHALIARHFPNQRWFGQKLLFNSGVWPIERTQSIQTEWIDVSDSPRQTPVPMYFIALASARSIPESAPFTLLPDPDETIYREFEQTVTRVATLEALTQERESLIAKRDAQLAARAAEVAQLEMLAGERGRIVEERDRQLAAQAERAKLMEHLIAERDGSLAERARQLEDIGQRASILDGLVAERERIIVERDAELVALNERVERVERLVADRDIALAATNARIKDAEALIAHRESLIVERDSLLEQTNQRAATLESLLIDRERIIVERDAQLTAANDLRSAMESRIGQLDAAAARATDLEQELHARQNEIARVTEEIASLTASQRSLHFEVERRGGLRWWLVLPYWRLRRALNLKPHASEQRQV